VPGEMPKGESNKFVYEGEVGTHKWYDGTQHPWEFKRVWHLEPSLTDPDHRLRRRGRRRALQIRGRRRDLAGTSRACARRRAVSGSPVPAECCLHTIILDPANPQRIFVAISAAGAFRTDDGGATWRTINRGLKSAYEIPDPTAEVGHCVHRMTTHPSRPEVLFMQKHWDVMRSDNAGEMWYEISGKSPDRLRLPDRCPRA